MTPGLQICTYLASRGYDVTMIAHANWEKNVTRAGVHYAPTVGFEATLHSGEFDPGVYERVMAMPRPMQLSRIFGTYFVRTLGSAFDTIRNALVEMKFRYGLEALKQRKLVLLGDTGTQGTLPITLGTNGLPPGFGEVDIKVIGIAVAPRWWGTKYLPPYGSGLPYDPSEEGIRKNLEFHKELHLQREATGGGYEEKARYVLKEVYGCTKDVDEVLRANDRVADDDQLRLFHNLFDATSACFDVVLHMSMESIDFPIPDGVDCVPHHFKYAGPLPMKPVSSDLKLPPWFDIIKKNSASESSLSPSERKRIVLVSQGTESLQFLEVIIPTIKAFANRQDVIVVAILAHRDYTLKMPDSEVPSNTYVVDYFPYDAVLQHADVFVSSSGFGGLTHAIANAVPLVQSGTVIDKPEIGRRVQYAGMGLFLENFPPKPEEIEAAVDEVLSPGGQKYKKRMLELQGEARAYRPLQTLEDEIHALASK